jgi:predicted lipoprotein with Yx(FWY)xxD motif
MAAPSTAEATGPSEPTDTSSNAGGTSTGTRIITADSEFGPMLYDASGQPIYLFTAESGDRPACYDDCAEDWPPVLTTDAPRGAADVRPRFLGSTRRTDGSTQVTYAGHPLYYYAHEGKYQVLCHDVEEHGGTWLVVRPDGTPAPS